MSDQKTSEKIITLTQEEIGALNDIQNRNKVLQAEYRDLGQLRVSLALVESFCRDPRVKCFAKIKTLYRSF